MTDVFISYSKVDKVHAEQLAADLKKYGLDVWWDTDLYASQDFHDTIMDVLNRSKTAIVIWSPNAIKSQWVRDEARRAHARKKLIPTYLPPFNMDNIPLGFGDVQTVSLNDREAIFTALSKFGITRTAASLAKLVTDLVSKPPKPLPLEIRAKIAQPHIPNLMAVVARTFTNNPADEPAVVQKKNRTREAVYKASFDKNYLQLAKDEVDDFQIGYAINDESDACDELLAMLDKFTYDTNKVGG